MEGRKHLQALAKGQENTALLTVVSYLETLEEMDSKFLNEEKTLKGMTDYIKSNASKQAVDGYACVEDEVVFEWAVSYWTKSDEELGLKSAKILPSVSTKPKEKKPVAEVLVTGQLSLF